jgi:signal peptidase I
MTWRRRLKDITLVISSLVFVALAAYSLQNKISLSMVTSRSMEPLMEAGDIVVSKQIQKWDIKKGDVLILPLPQNRGLKYMHRVVEVDEEFNRTTIRTKGDSNPNPDKWLIEVLSTEVPKVFTVLKSSFVFSSPIGRESIFAGLIGSAALLILLAAWRQLPKRSHR